jgi:hypothetical protein
LIKITKVSRPGRTRTQRIFKGAQTAQRHLVELTRNQFTIFPESKKRKNRTEIQKAEERTMAEPIPFKYGNKNFNAGPEI